MSTMHPYDRSYERSGRPATETQVIRTERPSTRAATDDAEDTGQLREQIEQTRADMGETIDAIQDRLSPSRIKEQVKDSVRDATIGRAENMVNNVTDTARQTGYTFFDTIRGNPIPAALVGIGLGWLLVKGASDHDGSPHYRSGETYRGYGGYTRGTYTGRPGYRVEEEYAPPARDRVADGASRVSDRVSEGANRAGDRISEGASRAGDQVRQVAGQASDKAQQLGDQAQQLGSPMQDQAQQMGTQIQYTAQRARYGIQDWVNDNPLGAGAIAMAAGVAIGLAVPSMPIEHQMMGEARDTMVDKAQEKAQETFQKAQHVAQKAQDAASQEAQKQGIGG